MDGKRNISNRRLVWVVLSAGCVLWVAASALFCNLPVWHSAAYLAFNVLCVALPGIALAKLFGLRLTPLESLIAAFGLGNGCVVVLFLLYALLGIPLWVGLAVLAALSAAALFWLRKRPMGGCPDTGELPVALVYCLLAGLITFITFSAANLTPDIAGTRFFYHDTLYGVSIVTSLSRGLPMTLMQMQGVEQSYYLFHYAVLAVFKNITGFSSFEVVTQLSLIFTSPFLAAAVIALAKRVLRNNRHVVVAGILLLIVPPATNAYNYYQDTLGYAMSLALAAVGILFFLKAEEQASKLYNRYYALSSVFFAFSFSAKGPLATAVLFGVFFSLLLSLIRKKRFNVLIQGLAYLIPVAVVFLLLFRQTAAEALTWSPVWSASRTHFFGWMAQLGWPGWIALPLCILYYTFSIDPALVIALGLIIYTLIKQKDSAAAPLLRLTLGGLLFAFAMINLFKQTGSSELYFLTAMQPAAYTAALYCFFCLLPEKAARKKLAQGILCLLFIPCLLLNVLTSGKYYYGANDAAGLGGALRFSRFGTQLQPDDFTEDYAPLTVTPQEYEALLWIRDNTPVDAVIVDGSYLGNPRNFTGSVFTECTYYLDGYFYVAPDEGSRNMATMQHRNAIVEMMYVQQDEVLLALLAREGCDYAAIFQRRHPGFYPSAQYADLVFDNGDVQVYRLHQQTPRS